MAVYCNGIWFAKGLQIDFFGGVWYNMGKKLKGVTILDSIEQYLYELLYEKDIPEVIGIIRDCTDSKLLHHLMANYNWDNGTELPEAVAYNPYCDIGTALMIFDLYGGYDYLLNSEDCTFSDSEKLFISNLKEKISNSDFQQKSIKYTPDLSRTVKYHIKKTCKDINDTFLDGTNGENIEIITV